MCVLVASSSTIDKIFEIFGPIFKQIANVNFEPIFKRNANFGPIFKKSVNFGPIFEKSVNFEHFVIGKWTQYRGKNNSLENICDVLIVYLKYGTFKQPNWKKAVNHF